MLSRGAIPRLTSDGKGYTFHIIRIDGFIDKINITPTIVKNPANKRVASRFVHKSYRTYKTYRTYRSYETY